MHECFLVITDNDSEINNRKYYSEYFYDDIGYNLNRLGADYIGDEISNENAVKNYLSPYVKYGFAINENLNSDYYYFYFDEKTKNDFLKMRLEKIKNICSNIKLETLSQDMFQLKSIIMNKYICGQDVFVYYNDEMLSFFDFVLEHGETDTKYYIVAAFDYHY